MKLNNPMVITLMHGAQTFYFCTLNNIQV